MNTIDEQIQQMETKIQSIKNKAAKLPSGSAVRGRVYKVQVMLEKDLNELKKQKLL